MNIAAPLNSALAVRDQFPAIPPGWHYLDSAATAQKPQAVLDALLDHYSGGAANVHRAQHAPGERAGDIMAIVAIVSLAAGINAWTFAGPRVYFAMARDNAFFKSAARVHPKYKTPAASIVAQAALTIVLILTGSLDAIANYVGFAITLFAGTAVAAVFVLRAREPNAPRPFKALGYPWTPAIFVLVSAAIVVNAFYSDPRVSLRGSLVILAGIPLYYFFTRKKLTG